MRTAALTPYALNEQHQEWLCLYPRIATISSYQQDVRFAAHCAKACIAIMMLLAYFGLNYLIVSGETHRYIAGFMISAFALGFWLLVRQEEQT